MLTLSEIDDADFDCANCDGSGWVCENHPECPWPEVCECGAGMPCVCNPLSESTLPDTLFEHLKLIALSLEKDIAKLFNLWRKT